MFTINGTITKICDLRTTGNGIAVRQIFFKKDCDGDYIYPSALGKGVTMLENFKPGDKVELGFDVRGSAEKWNNVVIEKLTKLN